MDDGPGIAHTQVRQTEAPFAHRTAFNGSGSEQRQLGAYYTCPLAAMHMAQWVIQKPTTTILEPSFGSGVFIRAIQNVRAKKSRIKVLGAEISKEEVAHSIAHGLLNPEDVHADDFLTMRPSRVDAVIGNPPYVRLRHLPTDQEKHALSVARRSLGQEMESSGSLWMPFVLHAMSFLKKGGRMALVLPYEFTYVRYGLPLWTKLGRSFGDLRVARVHERLFPDILQDVVILYADDFGGHSEDVLFETFTDTAQLELSKPEQSKRLAVRDIVAGQRSFVHALLPDTLTGFLQERGAEITQPIKSICTFNIGYVSGDKTFFNPSVSTRSAFRIPSASLVPAITNGRQLKRMGLRTTNRDHTVDEMLFLPKELSNGQLRKDDERYVQWGLANKVHLRYKCKVREPWYRVPGVKIPDVLLSVFADRPQMCLNDAELVASNSLLCGYMKHGAAIDMVGAWYTSLSMLSCELEVHSLGGGVMILVPNEAGRIAIPKITNVSRAYVDGLDERLRAGDAESAFAFGDEQLLLKRLKLSRRDLNAVRDGLQSLRRWRSASRSDRPAKASDPLLEDIQEEVPLFER
jgi:adenine-specific DNA-methyltransferase